MDKLTDIKALYEGPFGSAQNNDWHESYVRALGRARAIDEKEFRSATYQKELWELDAVSGIGPGNAVTVPGAYTDPEIVEALWQLKIWERPTDVLARARELDNQFKKILALVSPRHNTKRPSARLVRIFAALQPQDVLCLVDERRSRQFKQWLGVSSGDLGLIGQHVVSRQALRDLLGGEKTPSELVSYSQFAWFIWERIAASDGDAAENILSNKATDLPALKILPAKMQRKGLFYVTNNLRILMSASRAAENGIEKEDLLQQIAEEAPALSINSRKQVMGQAVSIGLLSVQGGTYTTTALGRSLLEGGAADTLTPVFARTVFGFALMLDDVRSMPGINRGQLAKKAQAYYPKWTAEFAPNSLLNWLRTLSLVEVQGAGRTATVQLSDKGEYWASGLPANLRSNDFLLSDELPSEDDPSEELDEPISPILSATPTADEIISRFSTIPALKRFVFSTDQLRLLHAALHAIEGKRFVLLAGLSGTGKTSMAHAYAGAYCDALKVPIEGHYLQVSVLPDWADPTGLMGFVNPLANPPVFHETPALRFLLAASQNPEKPYFLCLDEMNLARVEHYFAPFLSAMERPSGQLSIHSSDNTVDAIPPSIPWPRNLFIMGTVNMDETTHPFSDKVLDRAFTFEFWEADLGAWRARAATSSQVGVLEYVYPVLLALYKALFPARRHFGYRSCDEVLGFCNASAGLEPAVALDSAVLAKILPKIRGDSGGELPQALAAVQKICDEEKLTASAAKVRQMQASLAAVGTVRFWS